MANALTNAFKNKELRKKLAFTVIILIVVRFGSQLPIPGIDTAQVTAYLKSTLGDSFNLLNSFTGGSFLQMSVFDDRYPCIGGDAERRRRWKKENS